MIKKLFYIFLMIFLVSCGNSNIASFNNTTKGAAVSKAAASPSVMLRSILSRAETGNYRQGELLVKFRSGVAARSVMSAHQAVGATLIKKISRVRNVQHVRLPQGLSVKDAIIKYMSDPNVEYAEPNYIGRVNATVPNDPFFNPQQWALQNTGTFAGGTQGADIKMTQAWDVTQGSRGVIVAVVDSGVDLNHPDLVNNIWRNTGEPSCADIHDNDGNGFIADCEGWNFVDNNNSPMDDLGHGTHVSGIIGAAGNNGMGIAGMMWNVQIMPLKACDINGECADADVAAAVDYAVANGARVINMSLGSSSLSSTLFEAVSDANDAGILVTASAGNGGLDGDGNNNDLNPEYPAAFNLPNIIAVAATDQKDHRASFSNFGPNSVHVAAPGTYILSTVPFDGVGMSFSSFCTGSAVAEYDFCSGTSMAAPHVAGLAGLLATAYPNFTFSQIRGTILRYVDLLPTLQGWIQTGGRINAFRALTSLLAPSGLTATADFSGASVSLAWTDNATGEDGYTVERETGGGPFTVLATLGPDSTSFTDTTASPSTAYTYRVTAFNTIPATSGPVTAIVTTPAGDGSGSGGGTTVSSGKVSGGCSIGSRQNAASAAANTAVLFLPLLVLVLAKNIRRRKK